MESHRILFLGGGYTARRFYSLFANARCVFTSREPKPDRQYHCERFSAENSHDFTKILTRHGITHVVDSIPPSIQNSSDRLKERGEISAKHAVSRYLYLSSTAVYGVQNGAWVTEKSMCSPLSDQGKLRHAAENALAESLVSYGIFRLSGIYGPGRGVGISLQNRKYRLLKEPRWTNRVHVDDICELLKVYIEKDLDDPVLNVSDTEPAQMKSVVDWYLNQFNLPAPVEISISSLGAEENQRLNQNQRVESKRFQEIVGGKLAYPTFREGAGSEFTAAELAGKSEMNPQSESRVQKNIGGSAHDVSDKV